MAAALVCGDRPAAERRDNSVFPTFSAFDQFFRGSVEAVYAKRVDDEWWAQYSGPLVRRGPKGEFLAHYDPNILVDLPWPWNTPPKASAPM